MKIFSKIVALLLMCVCTLNLSAQTPKNYAGSSRFGDNWYIDVNGGVNWNLNDWRTNGGNFGLGLGRAITPIWGVEFQANAGVNDLTTWAAHTNHVHNGVAIDNLTAFGLVTFNLTNACNGYREKPYVFNVILFGGFGYGHGYDHKNATQSDEVLFKNALLTKVGAEVLFRVGKERSVGIFARPSVIWNTAGHSQYCAAHAIFNANAGVRYYFKTSNGHHYISQAPVEDYEARLRMVNELCAKMNKENTELKEENNELKGMLKNVESTPTKVDTIFVKSASPYTANVTFKQGSAIIADTTQVTELAKQINAEGKKVNVLGYASVEGSEKFNYDLSDRRANVVKNALLKAGVNKSLLGKASGMGTTTKFGESYEANRVVVVAE